jgi:hypothetical protein
MSLSRTRMGGWKGGTLGHLALSMTLAACGGGGTLPNGQADEAPSVAEGPFPAGRGWIPLTRVSGEFRIGTGTAKALFCEEDSECVEAPRTDAVAGFEAPIRVVCSGDAEYLELVALIDGKYAQPAACYPPGETGIRVMDEGASYAFVLKDMIPTKTGLQAGHGSYSLTFQAWRGRWREKVCGRRGSALPKGFWNSCVTKHGLSGRASGTSVDEF